MDALPDNLLSKVLSQLSFVDQFRVRRVSQRWKELVPLCMPGVQVVSLELLRDDEDRKSERVVVSHGRKAVLRDILDVYPGKIVLDTRLMLFEDTRAFIDISASQKCRVLAMFGTNSDLACDLTSYVGMQYACFEGEPPLRQLPASLKALKLNYYHQSVDMSKFLDVVLPRIHHATVEFFCLHGFYPRDPYADVFQSFDTSACSSLALRVLFVNTIGKFFWFNSGYELLKPLMGYPNLERVVIHPQGMGGDRVEVGKAMERLNAEAAKERPGRKLVFERCSQDQFVEEWAAIEKGFVGCTIKNEKQFEFLNRYQ